MSGVARRKVRRLYHTLKYKINSKKLNFLECRWRPGSCRASWLYIGERDLKCQHKWNWLKYIEVALLSGRGT